MRSILYEIKHLVVSFGITVIVILSLILDGHEFIPYLSCCELFWFFFEGHLRVLRIYFFDDLIVGLVLGWVEKALLEQDELYFFLLQNRPIQVNSHEQLAKLFLLLYLDFPDMRQRVEHLNDRICSEHFFATD